MPRPIELISTSYLQVVVLVLENNQGDILLSQRQKGKHLAGYWEFPGGKVENGESLTTALIREINEELNYLPPSLTHLTTVHFDYPNSKVQLNVFHCLDNQANVIANEQQNLKWINKNKLNTVKLPPANQKIVTLLQKAPSH